MLGAGGRLTVPKSESKTLDRVLSLLAQLRGTAGVPEFAEAVSLLQGLRSQVAAGYHRNPVLAMAMNPPVKAPHSMGTMGRFEAGKAVGLMSKDVHEIKYTHAKDGQNYRHPFETPTEMWAIVRAGHHDILITHRDGKPVWEDL